MQELGLPHRFDIPYPMFFGLQPSPHSSRHPMAMTSTGGHDEGVRTQSYLMNASDSHMYMDAVLAQV